MGWPKYFEDINEIVLERMAQRMGDDYHYLEIITTIPMRQPLQVPSQAVRTSQKHPKADTESQDQRLRCIDCDAIFVFTTGEQKFYEKKGLHPPKRCKSCREANSIRRIAFREVRQ